MEEVCSNSNNFFSRIRGKANRNKHVLKCKETKCHSILRKHFKASDKDFDSMDVASPYKGISWKKFVPLIESKQRMSNGLNNLYIFANIIGKSPFSKIKMCLSRCK